MRYTAPTLVTFTLALQLACTAEIGLPSGGPGPTTGPGSGVIAPPGTSDAAGGDPNAVGAVELRRLTRTEYSNAVRDLLGDSSSPGDQLPADTVGSSGFATALTASTNEVNAYFANAEALAQRAVESLGSLLPCAQAGAVDDACARPFVARLALRFFRRPLESQEQVALEALYDGARNQLGLDARGALRVVLTGLLQAPQFVYRWELGNALPTKDGNAIRFNDYELASRLSFFLWQSVPDEPLLTAAAAGQLSNGSSLASEAERLLSDPRARSAIGDFFGQWLQLYRIQTIEKDGAAYPAFTPAMRTSLHRSMELYTQSVFFDGDGRFSTLMSAPFVFVDGPLAALLGVQGVSGPELTRVDTNPAEGAGLLSQPGLLAALSGPVRGSPILRGLLVRAQLLCQPLPPPPDNIPEPPAPQPGVSERERLSQHQADPACASCHALMDPIGFGLERYDAVGRYHAAAQDPSIDDSGEIAGLDGTDASFRGASELGALLAASNDAQTCAALQLLRFATGRRESAEEIRLTSELVQQFQKDELDMRRLSLAIVRSRPFTHRAPSAGELWQ